MNLENARKRILVVEADAGARRLLGKIADLESAEPVLAGTGEEALELLEEEPFDLLVADRELPGINGLELARVARFVRPGMPVILVADCADAPDLDLDANRGIIDCILRPIIIDEACASLRAALQRAPRDDGGRAVGRIVVESRRETSSRGDDDTRILRRSSAPPPKKAGKLTVLVVEPDLARRAALTDVFAALGYDVVAFPSAARAAGQVKVAGFDLLVAGPDTLRERPEWLRIAGGRRPLGAMAIMDSAGVDKVIEAIQLGATGVVAPPFDRDAVLADLLIALDQMRKEAGEDED